MQAYIGRARWRICLLYRQLGPVPVLLFAVWLCALLYLTSELRPSITRLEENMRESQQELDVSLPMISTEQSAMQQAMSVTEYQQVKALFGILSKHQLAAHESRYNFIENKEENREQISLDIPMNGTYRQFYQALEELTATLPLQVNAITLSRSNPDLANVDIILRITLAGRKP